VIGVSNLDNKSNLSFSSGRLIRLIVGVLQYFEMYRGASFNRRMEIIGDEGQAEIFCSKDC